MYVNYFFQFLDTHRYSREYSLDQFRLTLIKGHKCCKMIRQPLSPDIILLQATLLEYNTLKDSDDEIVMYLEKLQQYKCVVKFSEFHLQEGCETQNEQKENNLDK